MAGDNVVRIEFLADDSSTTAAFSRLNAEVGNLGAGAGMGKAVPVMGQFTEAAKGASVASEDVGKKLEEAGRKAGSATGGIGAFRGSMRALRFDVFEVVAALGLMAKAVDEAGKAEASLAHLGNQGVSNVTAIKLEAAAGNENFQSAQYYDAAVSLKVAGVSARDLLTDVTELGKASRISDVPFGQLVDTAASMTEEFETGGIPSLSQMNTLTLASSGATQAQADKYRDLEKSLKVTEQAWKLAEEAQARTHKETTEHTSAIDSFAGKTGVAGDAFEAFKAQTSYQGGEGKGMMGGELMTQYAEGLKQLSQESGMGTQQIRGYMAAGKVGYEDLIAGSGRYRAHQQEELQFTQKQRDEGLRLGTEAKERALGMEALQSVMTPSEFKDKQADLQKLSTQGREQQFQAKIISAMEALGAAIVKWFPEIKVAMMVLAGVEIASRLAAINARFAPGLFGGGKAAAGGAAAAGGEAAAGGGAAAVGGVAAFPWLAAAADVVIPLLMTGDSSSKGKRWNQDEKRWISEEEQQWGAGGKPKTSPAMPASTVPSYGDVAAVSTSLPASTAPTWGAAGQPADQRSMYDNWQPGAVKGTEGGEKKLQLVHDAQVLNAIDSLVRIFSTA